MAIYKVLKDFLGSQTGTVTEAFVAGEQREISDYLAGCVAKGCIEPVGTSKAGPQISNKAITSDGTGGPAEQPEPARRGRPAGSKNK